LVGCGLEHVPPQLAELTRLRELRLDVNTIQGGWDHIPSTLRALFIGRCGLRHLPSELATLTRLESLGIEFNPIEDGWHHIPPRITLLTVGTDMCSAPHPYFRTLLSALPALHRLVPHVSPSCAVLVVEK
jgi:hypothetical protein